MLRPCIIGLDPTRFQNNNGTSFQEKELFTFSSQITDMERFKEADPLTLRCRGCKSVFVFTPLAEDLESVSSVTFLHTLQKLTLCAQTRTIQNDGITCTCGHIQNTASVQVQTENQLRAHITKYYEGVLGCSDCGEKTRSLSVYAKRCVSRPNCKGEMRLQVRIFTAIRS